MPNPMKNLDALKVPRKTKELDLGGYAEQLEGQVLHVWLNHTREMYRRYNRIKEDQIAAAAETKAIDTLHFEAIKAQTPEGEEVNRDAEITDPKLSKRLDENRAEMERLNDALYEYYAEIWSQHPDESTHVTAEDVKRFHENCEAEDPALWDFVTVSSQSMILAHRNRLTKN